MKHHNEPNPADDNADDPAPFVENVEDNTDRPAVDCLEEYRRRGGVEVDRPVAGGWDVKHERTFCCQRQFGGNLYFLPSL